MSTGAAKFPERAVAPSVDASYGTVYMLNDHTIHVLFPDGTDITLGAISTPQSQSALLAIAQSLG